MPSWPGRLARPAGLDGLDRAAAAGALDDADDRQAQLLRHALGEDRLHRDGGVGRAAAHREVVAQHDHRPAVDAGAPHDAIGRRQLGELAVRIVLGLAGDGADLVEAALVDQLVDALAHCEPAAVVLALHLVRPAHLARHSLALAEVVEFRFPSHASVPGWSCRLLPLLIRQPLPGARPPRRLAIDRRPVAAAHAEWRWAPHRVATCRRSPPALPRCRPPAR